MAGDLPIQKQFKMKKKLERQIDNAIYEINDVIINLTNYIEKLEKDLIAAEEHRKRSVKIEFEKGYEEGVKYTDGLISEEKNSHFKKQ
jgi:FKBP-type peptidyl-prolyl cis-trans isomerase 2